MYHGYLDDKFSLSQAALWRLLQGYQEYTFGSLRHQLCKAQMAAGEALQHYDTMLKSAVWDCFGEKVSSCEEAR